MIFVTSKYITNKVLFYFVTLGIGMHSTLYFVTPSSHCNSIDGCGSGWLMNVI